MPFSKIAGLLDEAAVWPLTTASVSFISNNGELYACGTCITYRNKNSSELCPISSMADLYEIINNADKLISF